MTTKNLMLFMYIKDSINTTKDKAKGFLNMCKKNFKSVSCENPPLEPQEVVTSAYTNILERGTNLTGSNVFLKELIRDSLPNKNPTLIADPSPSYLSEFEDEEFEDYGNGDEIMDEIAFEKFDRVSYAKRKASS